MVNFIANERVFFFAVEEGRQAKNTVAMIMELVEEEGL